jgi:hypothetical protein
LVNVIACPDALDVTVVTNVLEVVTVEVALEYTETL